MARRYPLAGPGGQGPHLPHRQGFHGVKSGTREADHQLVKHSAGGFVVATCILLAGSSLLAPGSVAPAAVLDVASAIAATAAWVAARRMQRGARHAWALLAATLTAWLAGDLVWDWYAVTRGEPPLASIADLLYVLGYVFLLAGVVAMMRLRSAGRNREVLLDAGALAIAAALLSWQLLITPDFGDAMPLLDRLVTALYPFADVFMLAALASLAWSPGRRGKATWLLFAFLALTLALDTAYAVLTRLYDNLGLDWINALYPVSYAFLAAAVLHPDAARIAESEPEAVRHLHPARLTFLALALISAPALSLLANGGIHDASDSVILAGAVALTAIVIARFASAGREREREAAHELLSFQATHDQLTGLVNRALLIDRIEHALERGPRTDASISVLYLDLDGFKTVNDAWGHRAGDKLLIDVAARLRGAVRPSDTVARLGGDEFVVLCEDLTDRNVVIEIAERVVASLAVAYAVDGKEIQLSASVGIVMHAGGNETAETLLRDADAAMYRAKEGGRNRWELFDSTMRAWVHERRAIEAALHGAVERGELRLLYQPEVRTATGDVVGFEALLRWERAGHGLVDPDVFLEIAAATGLISEIGGWVLDQACLQVAAWNDAYLDLPPLHLSVNVSGRELRTAGWVDSVSETLARTGMDPSLLFLEIPESALAGDDAAVLGHLEAVKRFGVGLIVDNFGTGAAAIARLLQVPIDRVKIDRVFTADLDSAPAETTTAAVMIALAHALGHETVANGVETAAQAAALRRLGCDLALGFYFARPLSLAEAGAMLRDGRRSLAAGSVPGDSERTTSTTPGTTPGVVGKWGVSGSPATRPA